MSVSNTQLDLIKSCDVQELIIFIFEYFNNQKTLQKKSCFKYLNYLNFSLLMYTANFQSLPWEEFIT